MASYDFDLFTIGAGSGGVAASRRAASYGAKVAIAEGSRVGGTCVLRGCVPKKLLVYGAQFADHFEDAAGFGWEVGETAFDWSRLIANKDRELDRLNGIYIGLLEKPGVRIVNGYARLLDPHTVQVGSETFTAKTILIATGGHPVLPNVPGAEYCLTSNEALELPALPESLVVLGGGYIALEFASIFAALGVAVTVLLRGDNVLRGFDRDVREHLATELGRRGIRIVAGVVLERIEKTQAGLVAVTADGRRFEAGQILAATGRAPNTRDLGLEAAGIETDPRGGIRVDEWNRTNLHSVYAVGDVTDRVALTPIAIAEGRALVETLFNGNPTQVSYQNIPTAVFCNPPVATVGLTEERARAMLGQIDVYRTSFRPMKNTLSGREERTLMKLVVDRDSDRVLGCHMVGPDGPEIIQGLAIALNCGATKKQFDQTIGLHPSAAEEFVTMREKVPEPTPVA
ncbi:glutathione-disulfide reductase [Arenibaculum pallidiluteum]|uniref:glutathione-disulfide reductase n=1 Tax=Arenibaculum pallidiluteum TaxID=2812559 RepID=UPI001A959077|nr:glutathione-disulfide reductase [Arenibaculum pallidiluteum]